MKTNHDHQVGKSVDMLPYQH